jgi:hypothetical protein
MKKRSEIVGDVIKRMQQEAAQEENQTEAAKDSYKMIINYLERRREEYREAGQ